MKTIEKLSMGGGVYELLAEVYDDPVMESAEERRQGTGTARVFKDLPVEKARAMMECAEARSRFFDSQPRGTGAAGKRGKMDGLANHLRTLLIETEAETAKAATAISPKGLPMKAKGIKNVAAFTGKDPVIEPKLDGWRVTVHVGIDKVEIWKGGGRENVAGHIVHIAERIRATVPPGTILDGEAVVMTSGDRPDDWGGIAGILAGHPKEERRQKLASFAAFDIISLFDQDLRGEPYSKRREYLEKVMEVAGDDDVWLVPQLPASEETIEHLIAHGFEGGIIKSADGKYHSGRRPSSQGKLKADHTEDVTVTGFTEGGGDFTGYIGAVQFKGTTEHGVEVTGQCSGMSWATRVDMTENPDDWIDTIIEIKHYGLLGSKLRHPQFKRRRPDK